MTQLTVPLRSTLQKQKCNVKPILNVHSTSDLEKAACEGQKLFVFVTSWGVGGKTVGYFTTKRKLENPDKEDSPFVHSWPLYYVTIYPKSSYTSWKRSTAQSKTNSPAINSILNTSSKINTTNKMVGWGWGFCGQMILSLDYTCFQKLLTQPEHQLCVLKGRVSSSSPSGPPAPQLKTTHQKTRGV